jgi:hypothetical protein
MSRYCRSNLADTRQPFTSKIMAELAAQIAERITGEPHFVVSRGYGYHFIVRYSGYKCGRG